MENIENYKKNNNTEIEKTFKTFLKKDTVYKERNTKVIQKFKSKKSKSLIVNDVENRDKSRFSCIIRKRYNSLIQEVLESNNKHKAKFDEHKLKYIDIKTVMKFFFEILQPIV